MPLTILIHINNEDPVVGEIEAMPSPGDTTLTIQNPRRRDGKDLHYLQSDVTSVVWPWSRISFMEVLPSGAEDEVIGFVRE